MNGETQSRTVWQQHREVKSMKQWCQNLIVTARWYRLILQKTSWFIHIRVMKWDCLNFQKGMGHVFFFSAWYLTFVQVFFNTSFLRVPFSTPLHFICPLLNYSTNLLTSWSTFKHICESFKSWLHYLFKQIWNIKNPYTSVIIYVQVI